MSPEEFLELVCAGDIRMVNGGLISYPTRLQRLKAEKLLQSINEDRENEQNIDYAARHQIWWFDTFLAFQQLYNI